MNGRFTTRTAAALLLAVSASVAEAEPQKPFAVPPTATILERDLVLRSEQSSKTDILVEYMPASDDFDRWNLLLGVRVFGMKKRPAQMAKMKEKSVAARRGQGDLLARSVSFARGETMVVDFVLSWGPIVEHNLIAFAQLPDGRAVGYQLGRRYYRAAAETPGGLDAFMGEIETKRDAYVGEIERFAASLAR
jgi:hypothetical protein